MLGELVRRYGFWLVDASRGGEIRKFYKNLKKHHGQESDTSSDLQYLLRHATETTDFYKSFRGCKDIRNFPIIKKSFIKENNDRFISSVFAGKPLHIMKTSGSTGERFAVPQNQEKRKRVLAELLYFNRRAGFHMGERFIYFRVWFSENKKSRFVQFAENMLPVDCSSLSDQSLEKLAVLLQKDRSITALKGYASSLGALADYLDRHGFTPARFHLKTILSGAERLDPGDKARLKRIFGCPVISRYSNQENGILAQQDPQSDTFVLHTAHYDFEFLQLDRDEPARTGEPARLILTDLHNQAMPFIRYDTGDIVIADASESAGGKSTVLKDVSGRYVEMIYDTRGNKVSPHGVALDFRPFDKIREYQLIQESQLCYTLKLVGARGAYQEKDLQKFLQKMLGEDAQANIVHVDEIPRPASGKMKKVICNWKKS